MSVPADKMIELFNKLNDEERKEVFDFASYLSEKKKKAIKESFKIASVDEEELSEKFVKGIEEAEKQSEQGQTISGEDVFRQAGL